MFSFFKILLFLLFLAFNTNTYTERGAEGGKFLYEKNFPFLTVEECVHVIILSWKTNSYIC